MKYKLVIFDLDGTLLNTIDDIADSMNKSLTQNGFKTYGIDEYKYFVGQGVKFLVESVLAMQPHTKEEWQKVHDDYMYYYGMWQKNKTKPYAGIIDLLNGLTEKGVRIAVLSNKPNHDTQKVISEYFPGISFSAVYGARPDRGLKPSPDGVNDILTELEIDKTETLYVGDTKVDMATAINSELTSVGVLWGFRTREELVKAQAQYIISRPDEILSLVF
jgi:phosphoglycolate phosphatase